MNLSDSLKQLLRPITYILQNYYVERSLNVDYIFTNKTNI